MADRTSKLKAIRREPPAFRRVTVATTEELTPRMRRITLAGPELTGFTVEEPAASVRLLIPSTGASELVMPEWTGNEFLLPDGRRPLIRTFTPRLVRSDPAELDIDIVLHGPQGVSGWATNAEPGMEAAVSGPGSGYEVDVAAPLVMLGDETAIPAICQILEHVPATAAVTIHIEAVAEARVDLHEGAASTVHWHGPTDRPHGVALLEALSAESLDGGTRIWAAGEAAAMQRLRKHLAERGIDRSHTSVRGYWKAGRAGPG